MLRQGMTNLEFQAAVLMNPFNKVLIDRLGAMGLNECYLERNPTGVKRGSGKLRDQTKR